MKTILVTGGAGFIGSHLCERLLALGNRVINLDSFNNFYDPSIKRSNITKSLPDPNYVLVEGDIRDASLLESIFTNHRIDTVVHLAALAGVRQSIENPLEYIDVDIKGTVNLLDFSKKHKVKKFVFASSSSVYGLASPPFKEGGPITLQTSPYAAAKYSGEQFCRTYHSLYKLPMVILRFFTVYGPRQRPEMAIHNFTVLMEQGREIPIFGDGKSSRDYTYIDDIVEGILSSIPLDCEYEVFNLGNSYPVKLNTLISLIEAKTGKIALKRFLPAQPGDMDTTCADITKAKKLLGYSPGVSIEEGIERFVHWYKSER